MSSMMVIHVSMGGVALIAGALALLARKGSKVHRVSGTVFLITMLIMALAGSIIAYQKPEMITLLGGLFVCYLVITAWLTIKIPVQRFTHLHWALAIMAVAIGLSGLYFGNQALSSPSGLKDGFPSGPYFFFGGLALFAAGLDSWRLLTNNKSPIVRIARHAWRMSFAMLMATASFFDGPGAKSFPESLHGSPVLLIPQLLVAVLLVYWLVRVLYFKRTA